MTSPPRSRLGLAGTTPITTRFESLERVGVGGIAEVYRARQLGLEGFSKPVALKVLRPELAAERRHVERLGMEARVGAVLDHPNIGAVYDFTEIDGRPTIVMEYLGGIDGLTLLGACTELRRRLSPALCAHVGLEVARALAYAHTIPTSAAAIPGGTLLVHGDISPANIMLTERGQVKLIDFGVAEASGLQGGPRGLRGKPGYMSPEVVLGRAVDGRSDVFSLAIVIWEMLTLKRLFKADTDAETLRNVAEVRVEGRFAKHDYLPAPLQDILGRALARAPADRFQSADDFAQALGDWLAQSGQHPSARTVADLVADVRARPLVPPPLPDAELTTPVHATPAFDLSELEAVLAGFERAQVGKSFERLVAGRWESPFDRVGPKALEPVEVPLDPWTLPALLARLARRGATGTLCFRDGVRRKVVELVGGLVANVESNLPRELLGSRLEQAGLITASEAGRGLALAQAQGTRVGDALVAISAISQEGLDRAVAEQIAARLWEVLQWETGTVSFEHGPGPLRPPLPPTPMLPLVARGLRATTSADRAMAALEPLADRTLTWVEPPHAIAAALELEAPELDGLLGARSAYTLGAALRRATDRAKVALLMVAQTEHLRLSVG